MNVLRYCNLDESLQGEASLVCDNALDRLFKTRELDYMSYIVLRMFENTEVRVYFHFTKMNICYGSFINCCSCEHCYAIVPWLFLPLNFLFIICWAVFFPFLASMYAWTFGASIFLLTILIFSTYSSLDSKWNYHAYLLGNCFPYFSPV